jgi:hypothetical protein
VLELIGSCMTSRDHFERRYKGKFRELQKMEDDEIAETYLKKARMVWLSPQPFALSQRYRGRHHIKS